MRWTKAWRRSHGKELLFDKSLEFEKRREEPVRYNRDLYVKTIQAMKKIETIRLRREKAFIQNRIKEAKKNNKSMIEKELMKHIDLISNKELKAQMKAKKDLLWEKEVERNDKNMSKLQRELQRKKEAAMEVEGDDDRISGDDSDMMSEEIIN
jgi:large subunit ribosomal protein L24e